MGSKLSTDLQEEKVTPAEQSPRPTKKECKFIWGGESIIDYFSQWGVPVTSPTAPILTEAEVQINIVIYNDIYDANKRSEASLFYQETGDTLDTSRQFSLTFEEIKNLYFEPEIFEDAELVSSVGTSAGIIVDDILLRKKEVLLRIEKLELALFAKLQKLQKCNFFGK